MPITLLCAAPGTGLSEVAQRIRNTVSAEVFDVESHLLSTLGDEDAKQVRTRTVKKSIDMKAFTSAFPRAKVLRLWSKAAKECIEQAKQHDKAVVVLHLTLFRNDRTEYYSTVSRLLSIIHDSKATIGHVVQLIDDVYDMYARLAQDAGALSFHVRYAGWLEFTERSMQKLTWERLNNGQRLDEVKEQVKLEARLQAINLLVSWRRHESIAAESLAGSLLVNFLVLGVKHPMFLLKNLLESAVTYRIYISHPISAYRREINKLIREGKSPSAGDWNEAVHECNSIPALLGADPRLLSIMPTAIDELRFFPLADESSDLTERSFILGPRWPLINGGDGLISKFSAPLPAEDEEVTSLLAPPLEPITNEMVARKEVLAKINSSIEKTAVSGELVRFLEGLMYIEIPYRDHLIVANTDGFLVHRPRADRARVSGGVRQEVAHWWDRTTNGEDHIKIAFLHNSADIKNLREHWLGQSSWTDAGDKESAELRRTAVEGAYDDIVAEARTYIGETHGLKNIAQIKQLLSGTPLIMDQLGGYSDLATKAAATEVRSSAILAGLAAFVRNELELCISEQESDNSHVFILDADVKLTERRMKEIRSFLTGESRYRTKSCTLIGDEVNVTSDTFLPVFLGVTHDEETLRRASLEFFERLERCYEDFTTESDRIM